MAALVLAMPLAAQPRLMQGDVLALETPTLTVLDASGHQMSMSQSLPLYYGVYAPSPDRLWFGVGSDIFTMDDGEIKGPYLSDLKLHGVGTVSPMRGGDLLAGETFQSFFAAIVRFSQSGDVQAIYAVPAEHVSLGVDQVESLFDPCVIAWTAWSRRVHAFDICERRELPDILHVSESDGIVRALRQLPNGDFLVAAGSSVVRFSPAGVEKARYPVQAYVLALTPDARGFWSAGLDDEAHLIEFASPQTVVRVRLQNGAQSGLAVVGEWRAALQPPPVSRRRSAGH